MNEVPVLIHENDMLRSRDRFYYGKPRERPPHVPRHLSPNYPSQRPEKEHKAYDQNRKLWYLGETVKKLYELDRNPTRKLFLDEYFTFMKIRGTTVTKVPVVAKLPLDLFRLYHVVQKMGGFAQVVKKRRWSRVVRELDLPSSITSAAFTLRTQYMRLLYPFECEKKGIPSSFLPNNDRQNWDLDSRYRHDYEDQELGFLNGSPDTLDKQEKLLDSRSYVTMTSLSEDNICAKSKNLVPREENLSPRLMKRPRSEELDRSDHLHTLKALDQRPHSINRLLTAKNEYEPIKRRFSDSDNLKSQRAQYENNENEEIDRKQHASPNYHDDEYEQENGHETRYGSLSAFGKQTPYYNDKDRSIKNSGIESQEKGFDPYVKRAHCREWVEHLDDQSLSPAHVGIPSPRALEESSLFPRIYGKKLPTNFHNSLPYHLYRGFDERSSLKERNGYHTKSSSFYRFPSKNSKLSTNPSEMNITIEDRTETAMALSIIVNGIRYTGTLLSNVQR